MENNNSNNNNNLTNDVIDMYNKVSEDNPNITELTSKTHDEILRENVLNIVNSSIEKVYKIDSYIGELLKIIFEKINNPETKMGDLLEFFEMLKGYRLQQYESSISPFKNPNNPMLNPAENNESDLDKLTKNMSSKDVKTIGNLSKNLQQFDLIVETLQEIVDKNKAEK